MDQKPPQDSQRHRMAESPGIQPVPLEGMDEILSLKSNDRREIFEEAAGISKYRHRKEETERKLAQTEDNLLRIGDKVSELELQLEPLKIQSEKARKYLAFREELKGVEVAVWLESLEKLSAATWWSAPQAPFPR